MNKCSGVICSSGNVCAQGTCVASKCGSTACPRGTYCKNNSCVPDILVCPDNANYKTTVCTEPRPSDVNCPVLIYKMAPSPLFCGVKADGSRVDFPRDC